MLGRAPTTLAAASFAAAAALAPVPALASIPVSTYVSQQDQSLQNKELREAINNVLNGVEKTLLSSIDANGNQKTEAQRDQDIERANRIVSIIKNIDTTKMALMILDANKRQPNVDLEKVIIAYILQELQQPDTAKDPLPSP